MRLKVRLLQLGPRVILSRSSLHPSLVIGLAIGRALSKKIINP